VFSALPPGDLPGATPLAPDHQDCSCTSDSVKSPRGGAARDWRLRLAW
jgi:hypothetical protein